jgi:hypothetical protein
MRRYMERRAIHSLRGRAALAFALGAVLLLAATSASAYKPAHSHSCGKVKSSVTYRVYTRHLSCDKGRRIFARILRQGRSGNWSCELREFPNGGAGIVCQSQKKRIYGVLKD